MSELQPVDEPRALLRHSLIILMAVVALGIALSTSLESQRSASARPALTEGMARTDRPCP
jgi:hypothetical protein